jgi:hypothetical protein
VLTRIVCARGVAERRCSRDRTRAAAGQRDGEALGFCHPQGVPGCTHVDGVVVHQLPDSAAGCEDCLRAGGVWLHLRICLGCGHVGCCDDSPARHASAHARETGHPLIRSLEPGEQWCWCFVDEVGLAIPSVTGSTRIPPSPMLA